MTCHFHPTESAQHVCHNCKKRFCDACTNEASATHRSDEHSCFICESSLEPLSAEGHIAPFWSKLNDIYQYPLHAQAVAAILVIALLSTLLTNWWLLGLAPAIAIYLYAFACLRETADGKPNAPTVEASFSGSVMPVIYVNVAMIAASIIADFVFNEFGMGMGILLTTVLVAVLPAAIITIAVEERLLPALNLANLLSIVNGTGTGYAVMVLFVIVMLTSMGLISGFLLSLGFGALSVFLTNVIGNYYLIIVFHIMGYLVYQNHQKLGYHVSGKAGVELSQPRSEQQRNRARLELLIKAGEFDAARRIAKNSLTTQSSIWEWDRAFKLFCAGQPTKELESLFDRYATKLEAVEDTDKLADAYLALKRVRPEHKINNEERRLSIAQSLLDLGKVEQAINLILGLPTDSASVNVKRRSFELLAAAFAQLPDGQKRSKHYSLLAKESMRVTLD